MRYFIDTEFDDDDGWPVLISLGVVCEDGREYYAESAEFDRTGAAPWLAAHVLPHLSQPDRAKPLETIRTEVAAFFLPGATEMWGMIPSYDWVILHRLFGSWRRMPSHIPWHCWDLRQWQHQLGDPPLPEPDPLRSHHALADARWAQAAHRVLAAHAGAARLPPGAAAETA